MENVWKHQRVWICVGLALATLAVYAQVVRYEFVDLDDGEYVFENWHVAHGLNLDDVVWAFTTGHSANWHPLTWLSHMVDSQLFGSKAGYHHLVSVLIHVVNTLLLFLLLQRLTGAVWRSAFVAGLFALHPLHVESVAWVAERKDVLSTFFLFLTLWAYADFARTRRFKQYLFALLFFVLGLMSKPMLVTVPFLLLLLDYWPLNRLQPGPRATAGKVKRSRQSPFNCFMQSALPLVREKIPFFLLSAASAIITFLVQKAGGAVQVADALTFDAKISNAIHSYAAYLVKTVWPAGLIVYYRYVLPGYPSAEILSAALVLFAITVLALHFSGRFPYIAFGWLWYLGTLVPVIGLVQVGGQATADRYTYIPLIGVFVAVAWGIPDAFARWRNMQRPLAAAGALLFLVCAVISWHQVRYWRDTVTLFSHALEIDKDNYLAHELMGTGLAKRGDYQEAVAHYTAALRFSPLNTHIMSNLGSSLDLLGKADEALAMFSRAWKIKPDDPIALRDMGRICFEQGRFAEAADFYGRAVRAMPDRVALWYAFGNALAKLGRNREAIDAYSSALRMEPSYAEALSGRGAALASLGRASESIRDFEEALRINPNYAEAHNNLGNILLQQGQMDKALQQYNEALRLNPKYAEAHYDLGVLLSNQGKRAEAISHYREAIRLKPDYADACYNLAGALEAQGDIQNAIETYMEAIRLKPDFVDAYNNLGVVLVNLGQIQKALDAFSEALRLNPGNADARRNRDAMLEALRKSKKHP
jgi:tetratricopeptide (TPR) repeat protein